MSSSALLSNNNVNSSQEECEQWNLDRKTKPNKIHIVYASQTGQAESISKLVYERCIDLFTSIQECQPDEEFIKRYCTSNYEKFLDNFWLPSSCEDRFLLIIVASTTGQGDPPDKATKFFRWLRKLRRSKTFNEQFKHLSYALLGLGDTNYDNFANFSKQLNKLFSELGATHYVAPAFADDAVGLELVTEPFIENLLQTLKRDFIICETNKNEIKESSSTSSSSSSCQVSTSTENNIVNHSNENIVAIESPENTEFKSNFDKNMNINRPVVSSCISLSSSDKCYLSDICRQLIEPSPNLINLNDGQLDVPKISSKNNQQETGFIYNQKNISELRPELNKLSIKEFLQNKVANKRPLNVGRVTLKNILSNENTKLGCCHKRKTVLECDVEYEFNQHLSEDDINANNENDNIQNDDCQQQFVPGDSFGLYSANLLIDVYQVLYSVKCKTIDNEDEFISLWDYFKGNKKQCFVIINDQKTVIELLPYLVYGVDLRTIPKKATIYHFAQFTTDQQQKRRLLELCSKQANVEYQNLILGQNITICDILRLFDTCHPPINVFLGHLIPAKPRYFSASSLPKITILRHNENDVDDHHFKCNFRIVFSVSNNFSHTFMRTSENLLGLFSGKFFRHYNFVPKNFQTDLMCSNVWKTIELIHENVSNGIIFDNQDVELWPSTTFPVYVFPRLNQTFKIDINHTKPLILISTGTGLAPFMSYFDALHQQKQSNQSSNHIDQENSSPTINNHQERDIFFIFGCRHPKQDFLYSNQLISYYKDQPKLITHLCLCFSRCSTSDLLKFEQESNIELCCLHRTMSRMANHHKTNNVNEQPIKHVDQLIRLHGPELVDLIINKEASIIVCGNWKIISDGIIKALTNILAEYHFDCTNDNHNCDHTSSPEAIQYVKQMKSTGRFIQDIWT